MKKNAQHNRTPESWAFDLWRNALPRWLGRSQQDFNYRRYVIHPLVRDIISDLHSGGEVRLLEIGCGDGAFTADKDNRRLFSSYYGLDVNQDLIDKACRLPLPPKHNFAIANAGDPELPENIRRNFDTPDIILSILAAQEIPRLEDLLTSLRKISSPNTRLIFVAVQPDFGERLITAQDRLQETDFVISDDITVSWRWAAEYPIADDPNPPFSLPYFHREIGDYKAMFEMAGFSIDQYIDFPDPETAIPDLTSHGIAPFSQDDGNVYWPLIAEIPSSLVMIASPRKMPLKKSLFSHGINEIGELLPYESLKERFIESLLDPSNGFSTEKFVEPDLYSHDRVSYIIPPITAVEEKGNWRPKDVFVVKEGTVAIGRVSYTRTSGEYLTEELILGRGDIFGEFEVPLNVLGTTISPGGIFPPRFNMTSGAWASCPALNWAMSYPRFIPRDSIAPDNAKTAVHPFYIKSKNIRPSAYAEIIRVPIDRFEELLAVNADIMTWFMMNILRKTRLYFEPPTPGYGRSPESIISRLMLRLLMYRLRLGIAVISWENGKRSCRTFIGPTEWLKFGFGQYMGDFKDIIQSSGGKPKDTHELPVFDKELENIVRAVYHYPVKDLDDDLLRAMGCSPEDDRQENRYGLLTGLLIEISDLDYFADFVLRNGE